MRDALDSLAEAFPADEISDAPWVVERGSIAWMIREGEHGPQVGNFILEADARWVAAARNAIESEAQRLTMERLREAETLLADAQPNGLAMSPVEWQERRHNLIAALARGRAQADRGAGLRLTEWEQVQLDAIRYRNQQAYIGVGPERLATIDVAWLLDRLDRALAREETGE